MNDVQNNTHLYSSASPPAVEHRNGETDCYNLDAHMSDSMKIKRPEVVRNDLPFIVTDKKPYTDYEANKKLKMLNDQIFRDTHNGKDSSNYMFKPLDTDKFEYNKSENTEVKKHEFNFKRYFTIFGIIGLLTAAIAYFRHGKG